MKLYLNFKGGINPMRKRILSLVLALAMMMSLFIVGAGAASFGDAKDITNKDAVDKMVSLNIINGRDNGNFDPTGIVTRAEMCKMICVALNGGNDPKLSGSSVTTFTDTKGHWAEGYIEYCVNMGIVAGMGNNTFAPDQTVTASQASKMLLVALGYDAEYEKFVGASWAINANRIAMQRGLYDDVTGIDPNAPMTRDNAAQMVYNFTDATMVKYEFGIAGTGNNVTGVKQAVDATYQKTVTVGGASSIAVEKETILHKYYKLDDSTTGILKSWTYDNDKKEFSYTVAGAGSAFKTTQDFTALFGQNVKVLFKDKGTTGYNSTDDEIYDISADDSMKVMSGLVGDMDEIKASATSDKEFKYDDVTYKLTLGASSIPVYKYGDYTPLAGKSLATMSNADNTVNAQYNFAVIDNTGDDKGDIMVIYPFTVAKITYVDSKSATTNFDNYKFEDCEIYDGIAKSDWAMIVDSANATLDRDTLTKVTKVTGEITSIKSSDQIVIDGTTYTNAKDATGTKITTGDTSYKIGNKMELVTVNGYIFNADKMSAVTSSDKVLCVIAADQVGTGTDAGKQQVKAIFADGTKKVIKVDNIDDKDVADANGDNTADANDIFFNDGSATPGAGTIKALNTMYTYSIDKDGNYEIDSIVTPDDYDAAKTVTTAGIDSGKMKISAGTTGTVRFADDAVVFYHYGTEYKAASGATVNSWDEYADGNITAGLVYTNETDGFDYVQIGYLTLSTSPADKDTLYGYITAKPELKKDGDDYYYVIKVWNGTETKEYWVEGVGIANSDVSSNATTMANDENVKKGTAISFKVSGDKTIDNVCTLKDNINAVKAYTDGKSYVGLQDVAKKLNGAATAPDSYTDVKITSDTKVIRYSSEDIEGQSGDGITVAKESVISGIYTHNCFVVINNDGEIEALIIDKDSAAGLDTVAKTNPDVLTDGEGINGSKIGVPNGIVANLGTGNAAAIKTYVADLFTNELTVAITDNGTTCTAAKVYASDGTLVATYTLTLDEGAGYALADANVAQATVGADTTAGAAYFNGLAAKGNCTLSFAWTVAAGDGVTLAAGDTVVITATTPNGDVLATATYTLT
jgi:hypothetical protein